MKKLIATLLIVAGVFAGATTASAADLSPEGFDSFVLEASMNGDRS